MYPENRVGRPYILIYNILTYYDRTVTRETDLCACARDDEDDAPLDVLRAARDRAPLKGRGVTGAVVGTICRTR